MGGKSKAIQTVLDFGGAADDAGDAVRSLLAGKSFALDDLFNSELVGKLPPDIQLRLMRNDPSVISDIMALGRGGKANIDDVAARATPLVEIPYANQGVGRREAPLDPSGQQSFERGLVPYGYRGRGIPVGLDEGPGTGLIVVDAGPSRRTPGAGRRENPLDPSAGWTSSGGTDLIPFPGGRGPGVPVGGVGDQSMIVYQAPRRDFSGLLLGLGGAGAIGTTAYALNRATQARPKPEVLFAPQRASRPIDVLLGMGIHPERAETLVASPQYMTDSEARRFRSLPPEQRDLFLNR